jgi:hypothetical protein
MDRWVRLPPADDRVGIPLPSSLIHAVSAEALAGATPLEDCTCLLGRVVLLAGRALTPPKRPALSRADAAELGAAALQAVASLRNSTVAAALDDITARVQAQTTSPRCWCLLMLRTAEKRRLQTLSSPSVMPYARVLTPL